MSKTIRCLVISILWAICLPVVVTLVQAQIPDSTGTDTLQIVTVNDSLLQNIPSGEVLPVPIETQSSDSTFNAAGDSSAGKSTSPPDSITISPSPASFPENNADADSLLQKVNPAGDSLGFNPLELVPGSFPVPDSIRTDSLIQQVNSDSIPPDSTIQPDETARENVFKEASAEPSDMVFIPETELSEIHLLPKELRSRVTGDTILFLPGFYIDLTEVTNTQFADFLNSADSNRVYHDKRMEIIVDEEKKYSAVKGKELHPATFVSWYGAMAYAHWAGKQLPTELEWMLAAAYNDSLDDHPNPWGDDSPDSSHVNLLPHGDIIPHPIACGSRPEGQSALGIQDLLGNVAEWTISFRKDSLSSDDERFVIVKGGSFLDPVENLGISKRYYVLASTKLYSLGFRCVKRLEPVEKRETR